MPLRHRSVMVDRCAKRVCNFFGVAETIGWIFARVNFFHKLVTSSVNEGSSKNPSKRSVLGNISGPMKK